MAEETGKRNDERMYYGEDKGVTIIRAPKPEPKPEPKQPEAK